MTSHRCIRAILGKNVVTSPREGQLRLALSVNAVWRAVERLGGVKALARQLGCPKHEIHRWIDEHFVPHGIVEDVAHLAVCSVRELQAPEIWIGDGDFYWPASGYLSDRAEETRDCHEISRQKRSRMSETSPTVKDAPLGTQARAFRKDTECAESRRYSEAFDRIRGCVDKADRNRRGGGSMAEPDMFDDDPATLSWSDAARDRGELILS